MKRFIHLSLTVTLAFLFQSCATVNIESNKLDSYNKQPKKIYIIANFNKDDKIFCSGLVSGLKDSFTKKGVQCDSYLRDALSLETDDDVNRKASNYGPEAVMLIQQTVTGGGKATFELTLIDTETKKRVWKGAFDISTDNYYSSMEGEGSINRSVKAILEKLTQDKIIS